MKYVSILLLSALFFTQNNFLQAQSEDEVAIEGIIKILFDGMRASDSTYLIPIFEDEATLESIYYDKEGKTEKRSSEISGFITAVGQPKDQVWDERIHEYDINVDDPLAIAWTPYSFYVDEKFSHCGVNVFKMVKTDGQWKISGITDTRKQTDCEE